MTPLQIIDDELRIMYSSVRYYHQAFRDALFRCEETMTDFDREMNISQQIRIQTAKGLVERTIREIRIVRRIKHQIQDAARYSRQRRART